MPEENKEAKPTKTSSGRSCLIIFGTIILALAILLGLYLGIAYVLRRVNNQIGSTTTTSSKTTDQNIAGNWDTGCLVPDPNSPWAERHTFTINSNGTANHKRYSGSACPATTLDQDDNINFTIPSQGKINLSYTSGVAAGHTIYDIYQVSGDTLKFGHGFCNCDNGGQYGGPAEANRFTSLNNFLVYKKQ